MTNSSEITDSLKAALAKASSLPPSEQDEIAKQIMARAEYGDLDAPWPAERSHLSAIGDFLDSILPNHNVARSITLIVLGYILFVMAPMMLIGGIFMGGMQFRGADSGAPRQVNRVAVDDSNRSNAQDVGPRGPVPTVAKGEAKSAVERKPHGPAP